MKPPYERLDAMILVRHALVLGAVSLAGCIQIGQLGAASPSSGTFAGDACDAALYPTSSLDRSYDYNRDEKKFPEEEDSSPKAQILLATCRPAHFTGTYGHDIHQWSKVKPLDPMKAYLAFDDRKFDDVTAALIVVMAVQYEMPLGEPLGAKGLPIDRGDALRGMALGIGEMVVTNGGLDAALGGVDVPPDARAAFHARFDAALSGIRAKLTSVGDKRIYAEVPLAVYKERVEHFRAYAEDYEKLDGLKQRAQAEDADKDDIIAKLGALRASFLAECKHVECTKAPIYAEASHELATLYVLKKDVAGAEAESLLFSEPGSYIAGFPQAIRAAQAIEIARASKASQAEDKAIKSGLDVDTARRLTGVSADDAFSFDAGDLVDAKMSLPDVSRALRSDGDGEGMGLRPFGGKVIAVEKASASATRLRFERHTSQYEEDYNCVQTNRLVAIHEDGTLEYEEVCQHRPVTESHDVAPPSLVPLAEAKAVKAGDEVSLVGSEKDARVVRVTRGKKIVQVRGDAVPE